MCSEIPIIDVSLLIKSDFNEKEAIKVGSEINKACREIGFFCISNHGVPREKLDEMDKYARKFFELPNDVKKEISMKKGGRAWRGWFPVGDELTSGKPDRKEGLYCGIEHDNQHPLVQSKTPLHGQNLFPASPPQLGASILDWIEHMTKLAHALMRGIALGLGLPPNWFQEHLTADPTVLFRIFHYPPGDDSDWGVAEHTDYGILTILAQDSSGGLQVKSGSGADAVWIDVPANPDVFVCNIGDMLEKLTGGRYRSTPHRVRNLSGVDRLSFPLFFDPSWNATVPELPLKDTPPPTDDSASERWDKSSVLAWQGTYGDYLTKKVSKVFPWLVDELK